MSFNNIKTKAQGFTIVELLIVVVVIAILAAITIVSYNGITARANTSAAQSLATNIAKKSEVYAADDSTGGYPQQGSDLTNSANSSKAYYIPSTSVTFGTPGSSNGKNTVQFLKCAATTPTPNTQAGITQAATTGVRIVYYDFTANATKNVDTGNTAVCPTS